MAAKRCDRCKQIHLTRDKHPSCTGHADRGRRPCRNNPRNGQLVCNKHGGKSPQALAAAEQRLAEEAASKLLRRFGGPIDTTPTEALLDTVKWTAGYVAWLRDRVADITSDEKLVWNVTRRKTGGEDHGTTHEAKPTVWLELLGTWSDRLVKVCAAAINAGIEERRVRIAEQQGALVADVIRKILGDLELTPDQVEKAGEAVPFRLRAIAGGAAS